MASSNRCSVCPKGAGTCFCPGCKSYFCDNDFISHRGMLVNGLDEITIERNELQEKINKTKSQKQSGTSILSRIDEWEEITIEKVKQAAEQVRQQVLKMMNSRKEEIMKEFQSLSQELEQLRETRAVLEQDLTRFKQQIARINIDLSQLSQLPAIELNTKQSDQIVWNRMIYVVENKSKSSDDLQLRSSLKGEDLNRLYHNYLKHPFSLIMVH